MRSNFLFRNKAFNFILLLLILVACWYLGRVFKFDVEDFQTLLSEYPLTLSGLIFVLLYVITTTFIWFGPKDVLRISGAILFGGYVSTLFVWIGEMCNALIMFHLSRVLGREYIVHKFRVKAGELDKVKDDASLLAVIAWRINPMIPFRVMDLGYGLTGITFRKYFLGIVAVSFVRILWLQYILAGIGMNLFKEPAAMIDYFFAHPSVIRISAFYFLAIALVTAAAFLARWVRKRRNRVSNPS